jgi:peptide/nickel transport system permease protein
LKLENLFERWIRRLFSSRPVLAGKLGLEARNVGRTMDRFFKTRMGKIGILIIAFFLFVALYSRIVIPNPPPVTDHTYQGMSWAHPFGTDQNGRDVFVRTIQGTEASLTVGFVAMAIAMILGTLVGLSSGYLGGWSDEVIMRINDVFLSIPWLVLMIVIASVWGRQDLLSVIVVIGITGWSGTARIVRSQVLTLKSRQFVERAKAIGSSDWHIIRRHIFPNVVPLIFANAILTVAMAILSEASLSFLRLGPTNVETWGRMLEEASRYNVALVGPYSYIIMPGLCIVFIVLGFTFIGYAMDEVLNPKLRER